MLQYPVHLDPLLGPFMQYFANNLSPVFAGYTGLGLEYTVRFGSDLSAEVLEIKHVRYPCVLRLAADDEIRMNVSGRNAGNGGDGIYPFERDARMPPAIDGWLADTELCCQLDLVKTASFQEF